MIKDNLIRKNLLYLAIFVAGFILGDGFQGLNNFNTDEASAVPLREHGKFTNPLLICDTGNASADADLEKLEGLLRATVDKSKGRGIVEAAIYFRDMEKGTGITVNPDVRFIPASLNKVPLMITAFKHAQGQANFLRHTFVYEADENANGVQMVQPRDTFIPGNEYSIEDALQYMITYSDNGAYNAITNFIEYDDYLATFESLMIPTQEEQGITVNEYSYFLRVLYNSTYLNREYSEKALALLAETDYVKGIAAGTPDGVMIAHKFGVSGGIDPEGMAIDRQLHDCGIVYHPSKPYLLCVMTKSNQELSTIEAFIAEISRLVYGEVSSQKG